MCGICGLLSLDGVSAPDREALEAMSARLEHRGPDSAGALADGPVALAVRRLAIIDVPGGDQPIANEDGSVHVVLNGEIYNFRSLREGLARRGHRFSTGTDTEVLVHLYEERGPGFVRQLRGMFAFALWDAREQRLLLARDRFGIKPLVYSLDSGRLAFASELKALLALEDFPREVDVEALETYLTVNAVMAPRTMFAAARKLPPGHLMSVEGGRVRLERYARDLPVVAGAERHEPVGALAGELRDRLRDSVRAHLVADVPVGILLSGGVDSGAITALATAETGPALKTFTVGFGEPSFDELEPARAVARRYGTDHHELVIGPEAADELRAVAWTFDEPRGDATALPYWLAARLASEHVKVVLSGEGGDELFGGYQTYVADRLGPWPPRAARAMGGLLARVPSSSRRLSLDFKLRRLALGAGLGALERHHAWKQILSPSVRGEVLLRHGRLDPLDGYRARYAESAGADPLARLQDLDVGTFLADDLLAQTDRAGMAHSLEIRVPFLDPVVAAFALALPARAKLGVFETKRVLRAAAAPLLPRAIVRGPKRGFVPPAAAWLRGPLLPLAREILSPGELRRQGWFAPAPVQRMLQRHVSRQEDLSRPLWALMAFGLWHDEVLCSARPRPTRSPLEWVGSSAG